MHRIASLLVVGWSLTVAPLAGQQPGDSMRVAGDRVNLRSAPSIDSTILRSLARNTMVVVRARQGAWIEVQAAAVHGWMRSELLTLYKAAGAPPAASTGPATAPQAAIGAAAAPTTVTAPPPASPVGAAPSAPAPLTAAERRALPRVHGFLFGGLSSATVHSSNPDDNKDVAGLRGGFVAAGVIAPVARQVALSVDVGYVQEGELITIEQVGSYGVRETYAQLSGLVRPTFAAGTGASLFLMLGPYASYALSCGYSGADSLIQADSKCTFENTDVRSDVGLVVGAGLQVSMLTVQLRYELGLKNQVHNPDPGESLKRRTLLLGAGIVF